MYLGTGNLKVAVFSVILHDAVESVDVSFQSGFRGIRI